MANDSTASGKTSPSWEHTLLSSAVTASGIALAIASFVWIEGDKARFAASAAGLALVLWGRYLRRRAFNRLAEQTESPGI